MPYDESVVIPWFTSFMKEMGPSKLEAIFMNASTYAGIRKLEGEDLDIESQPLLWKTGLMGELVGVKIRVVREIREIGVIIIQRKGEIPPFTHCTVCRKNTTEIMCPNMECLVQEVLEK